MTKEALNIASQCRATASHDLDGFYGRRACNIAVDGGSGLLRELLIDAAMVIEDLAQPKQRTWVGLTEREQGAIMEDLNAYGTNLYPFAQAIEAKLKERNA